MTVVGELPETRGDVGGISGGDVVQAGVHTGLNLFLHLGPLLAGRRVVVALNHDLAATEVVRVIPVGTQDVTGGTHHKLRGNEAQGGGGTVTLCTAGQGVDSGGEVVSEFAALGFGDVGGRSTCTGGLYAFREADGIGGESVVFHAIAAGTGAVLAAHGNPGGEGGLEHGLVHTPPGVTGTAQGPVVLTDGVVDLGYPDGFVVAGIVGVGVSGEVTDLGHAGGTEEVPVGALRGSEGVAVTVHGLVGTVTEAGGHELVVAVGLVDDAGGSLLGLLEFTQAEVNLGEVVGGGSLGDGTHQTRSGGKVLLGIFKVGSQFLPGFLAGVHGIVVTGFLGHVLGIYHLAEHAGNDTEGPGAEEHGLCTEVVLHRFAGVLDLGMLVNHVHHNVGTVGKLVHVFTVVTGITTLLGKGGPVGEMGVATGGGDSVQTQAEEHPVVLGSATLVAEHHVLDLGIGRGKGNLNGLLALEEAVGIVLVCALFQEEVVVTGNGQDSCEKNNYILFHNHLVFNYFLLGAEKVRLTPKVYVL